MTPVPLSAFVHDHGQDEAARILGSSQTAISKALRAGRLILIAKDVSGAFSAVELKAFPSGGSREKSCLDLEEIVSQVRSFSQSADPAVNPSSMPQAGN